jgi:hypothetical protein
VRVAYNHTHTHAHSHTHTPSEVTVDPHGEHSCLSVGGMTGEEASLTWSSRLRPFCCRHVTCTRVTRHRWGASCHRLAHSHKARCVCVCVCRRPIAVCVPPWHPSLPPVHCVTLGQVGFVSPATYALCEIRSTYRAMHCVRYDQLTEPCIV